MIWIMLATLAVVFVVGFRVLTSGARKAIRRLSDRLNIDVVPVESMVDQMGKSAGDEFLRYLHRPDESHLQNAAQVLLIWQIVIVDGSEQNLLQWHRILQKARLAAPITDAQVRLALGGFWAMSASLTMRLVPPRTVPKALSVIFGAVSIALVIAAPLGSFLGELIGWRNVFNAAAAMGVLCIFWIIKSLPSLPGEPSHQKQNTFRLLQRPGVMAGMIAIFMSFAGQFAFFTYIRPVYMNLAGFGVDGLTLVLLSFGIASFVGTSLSSFILKRSVKLALAGAPFVLALSALVLTLWGSDKIVATGVAIIWGLTFALIPVGWSTWITRSLADQAEKAGSIQVAVIQLANTCGAAIGGYALDNIGLTSPLMLSGTLMLLTALLVTAKVKMKKS